MLNDCFNGRESVTRTHELEVMSLVRFQFLYLALEESSSHKSLKD